MKLISTIRPWLFLIAILTCGLLQAQPLSKWGPIGASAAAGSTDDGSFSFEGHVQFALGDDSPNYIEASVGADETETSSPSSSSSLAEELRQRLAAVQFGIPLQQAFNPGSREVDVVHVSLGFRRYFLIREKTAFYLSGAPGVYVLDPGEAEFGWRVKGGFEYRLGERLGIDLSAAYKRVSNPGDDLQYGSFLAGLIYHFGD